MRLRAFGQHAGGTGDAGAAQQVKQDRLGLVIAMMRQRHRIGRARCEHRMTHSARGGFQAFAAVARHFDANNVKRNRTGTAELSTELGPAVSIRADTVMHVDSGKYERDAASGQSMECMQEHDRIAPARERDAHAE